MAREMLKARLERLEDTLGPKRLLEELINTMTTEELKESVDFISGMYGICMKQDIEIYKPAMVSGC